MMFYVMIAGYFIAVAVTFALLIRYTLRFYWHAECDWALGDFVFAFGVFVVLTIGWLVIYWDLTEEDKDV